MWNARSRDARRPYAALDFGENEEIVWRPRAKMPAPGVMMHEGVSGLQRNSRIDAEGARVARPHRIS
jgi:hypothetical protein